MNRLMVRYLWEKGFSRLPGLMNLLTTHRSSRYQSFLILIWNVRVCCRALTSGVTDD